MKRNIIVIAGPTAVGKTAISIEIAERVGGQIVSCDSMQLYRHMDIGSAKPTPAQLLRVPHHLIGVVDPKEPFSVVQYQRLAKEALNQIFQAGQTPVVTGGTGLYLNSLLYDMDFGANPCNLSFRTKLFDIAAKQGNEALHQQLQSVDPDAAQRIHPNNVKRVVRALEALHMNGTGLADFSSVKDITKDYDAILIGLSRDRQALYRRIEDRVDQLMEAGLLDEVRWLKENGFTSADISMKGIGYKELLDHLSGAYDLPHAVDLIKKNTRHYAKRQMTWFKRYEEMQWFDITHDIGDEETVEKIMSWLNKKR